VFTAGREGKPVTHMSSTNSKPQPSNQFFKDKIKFSPTFYLKGLVHPKMKIKSLITHPHAVPTP